jgi:hypothetical protein
MSQVDFRVDRRDGDDAESQVSHESTGGSVGIAISGQNEESPRSRASATVRRQRRHAAKLRRYPHTTQNAAVGTETEPSTCSQQPLNILAVPTNRPNKVDAKNATSNTSLQNRVTCDDSVKPAQELASHDRTASSSSRNVFLSRYCQATGTAPLTSFRVEKAKVKFQSSGADASESPSYPVKEQKPLQQSSLKKGDKRLGHIYKVTFCEEVPSSSNEKRQANSDLKQEDADSREEPGQGEKSHGEPLETAGADRGATLDEFTPDLEYVGFDELHSRRGKKKANQLEFFARSDIDRYLNDIDHYLQRIYGENDRPGSPRGPCSLEPIPESEPIPGEQGDTDTEQQMPDVGVDQQQPQPAHGTLLQTELQGETIQLPSPSRNLFSEPQRRPPQVLQNPRPYFEMRALDEVHSSDETTQTGSLGVNSWAASWSASPSNSGEVWSNIKTVPFCRSTSPATEPPELKGSDVHDGWSAPPACDVLPVMPEATCNNTPASDISASKQEFVRTFVSEDLADSIRVEVRSKSSTSYEDSFVTEPSFPPNVSSNSHGTTSTEITEASAPPPPPPPRSMIRSVTKKSSNKVVVDEDDPVLSALRAWYSFEDGVISCVQDMATAPHQVFDSMCGGEPPPRPRKRSV